MNKIMNERMKKIKILRKVKKKRGRERVKVKNKNIKGKIIK